MKPNEWNALQMTWEKFYPVAEAEVRSHLEFVEGSISTNDLVEALYPAQFARGEGITTRQYLYKAIRSMAPKTLSDCATRGEPVKSKWQKGRMDRPWQWHASTGVLAKTGKVCPHCGGAL